MAKERSGDTQERIEKCLSCTKVKCNNCFDNPIGKTGRKNGSIIESEFMKLYKAGLRDFEIATVLGVTASGVYCFRRKRKLPANRKEVEKCETN